MNKLADTPAFPGEGQALNMFGQAQPCFYEGMTYRQWLAGLAMQALIAKMPLRQCIGICEHKENGARGAVLWADALIAELEKHP